MFHRVPERLDELIKSSALSSRESNHLLRFIPSRSWRWMRDFCSCLYAIHRILFTSSTRADRGLDQKQRDSCICRLHHCSTAELYILCSYIHCIYNQSSVFITNHQFHHYYSIVHFSDFMLLNLFSTVLFIQCEGVWGNVTVFCSSCTWWRMTVNLELILTLEKKKRICQLKQSRW